MLHEDKSAGVWKERGALLLTDYFFQQKSFSLRLHPKSARAAIERQKSEPVRICERDGRQWWWFKGRFYCEDDGLTP